MDSITRNGPKSETITCWKLRMTFLLEYVPHKDIHDISTHLVRVHSLVIKETYDKLVHSCKALHL